jgi:hypothetical protein
MAKKLVVVENNMMVYLGDKTHEGTVSRKLLGETAWNKLVKFQAEYEANVNKLYEELKLDAYCKVKGK